MNFTAPNVEQSLTFQTAPSTANVVISVSNLPSGVSSASSCTTASTGSCSVVFTANSSAYGSKALTLSASAVKTPPAPTISVANTTMRVADATYMAASGTLSVTLTNTGNFAWQTGVSNALQVTGSNVTEFGVDTSNCTASPVAPGGTCTINFSTTGANAGDGVSIAVESNATQSGNGNVYINGGVSATLSGQTSNTFTNVNQTQTLTLTNTSDENGATINTVAFTNGTSDINDISVSNNCSSALSAGASCTVIYTSQASSYGSDTITVNYTLNGKAQSVESSTMIVGPTTLTMTASTQQGGGTLASGSFINLSADTNTQVYTINASPFTVWQNPSVSLSQAITGDTSPSQFMTSTCTGSEVQTPCTATFNTAVSATSTPNIPNIAPLTFPDITTSAQLLLNVSGNISGTPPSWPIAPAVGMFMQGGVIFWVGPNTGAITQPGYRQAMVSAVTDVGNNNLAWNPNDTEVGVSAQYLGFFAGPSGAATGLTNTNAICHQDAETGTTCKSTGTSYPAAQAAQSYNDSGSHGSWFLPAGSPVDLAYGYGYCNSTAGTPTVIAAGELCELYNQRAIIDATATAVPARSGSAFNYNAAYWSSSEYAQDTNNSWGVYFLIGTQYNNNKVNPIRARPVRAFSY